MRASCFHRQTIPFPLSRHPQHLLVLYPTRWFHRARRAPWSLSDRAWLRQSPGAFMQGGVCAAPTSSLRGRLAWGLKPEPEPEPEPQDHQMVILRESAPNGKLQQKDPMGGSPASWTVGLAMLGLGGSLYPHRFCTWLARPTTHLFLAPNRIFFRSWSCPAFPLLFHLH